MKIIHVLLGKAKPDNTTSGVSKVVFYLAKYQEIYGAEVYVISITKNSQYDGQILSGHPRVEIYAQSKTRFLVNKGIIQRIKEIEPDIVHFHSVFIPEFQIIGDILTRMSIPYVITPHGGYRAEALKRNKILKKNWLEIFESRLLKRAKMIHFLTQQELMEFESLGLHCRALKVIVPNGVEDQPYYDYSKAKSYLIEYFKLPIDSTVILFLGRLDIYSKGLDLLMQGFSIFSKKIGTEKTYLLLVGPDINNSLNKLSGMAERYGISKRVNLFGPVFGGDKFLFMSGADLFIVPSRSEGLPTVLLEALSVGARCLVSYGTGMADDILNHEAGWVCKLSPEAIAEALLIAIKEIKCKDKIQKISNNAINLVRQKYSWDTVAEKILSYYKELSNVG